MINLTYQISPIECTCSACDKKFKYDVNTSTILHANDDYGSRLYYYCSNDCRQSKRKPPNKIERKRSLCEKLLYWIGYI